MLATYLTIGTLVFVVLCLLRLAAVEARKFSAGQARPNGPAISPRLKTPPLPACKRPAPAAPSKSDSAACRDWKKNNAFPQGRWAVKQNRM